MTITMSPPTRGEVLEILRAGAEKYGWRWMKDESGDWWGAKERENYLLQVQEKSPDFPTRRWSETMDGYTPRPRWEDLRSVLGLERE